MPQITELPSASALANTDVVLVVTGSGNSAVTSQMTVTEFKLLFSGITPANSTATTVLAGQSWYDDNYLYIATADNIVKRVALSTFP